jgi:glycosyltransferase involved in cell wall biosynthesis
VPVVARVATPLVLVARESSWPASADLDTAVALERWIIEHADGMSHSTSAIRATIEQEMGAVVPDERAAASRTACRRRPTAATAVGPPRLLFVGRLEPRKGIDTLLAIVPSLLARYPDLVVDVVGQDMPWPEHDDASQPAFPGRASVGVALPLPRRCRRRAAGGVLSRLHRVRRAVALRIVRAHLPGGDALGEAGDRLPRRWHPRGRP